MKAGEVVELGRHRLMCGDSNDPAQTLKLMGNEKPDMLYCDPPYGISHKTNYAQLRHNTASIPGRNGHKQVIRKKWKSIEGDNQAFDPRSIINEFSSVGEQFWWGADKYREWLPSGGSWIVWDKRVHERCDKFGGSKFELCWSRATHPSDIARILWSGVLGMNGPDERMRVHPTQKPIRLAEWFIDRYSKSGSLVLDLFAGSGSTLLACERTARRCYAMEIDPEYCNVIVEAFLQRATVTG